MAIPWNIRGSASQLLFEYKELPQYQALLAIADVPHPDRSILAGFINDAVAPQEAARYFLHMTCTEGDHKMTPKKTKLQFLSEWRSLVDKFRPTLATSLSSETKMLICERDACRCCLTRTPFKSYLDHDIEYVHIVPPCVLSDPDLSEEMLSSFPSRNLLERIRNLRHEGPEKVDNVWLLSKQAWNVFQTGNPASKYHVEAHTLRMIEQSTCIPAPRALDVLETSRFSYLLMTRVPGRPIGQVLNAMTDEQVEQAVVDLKTYVSELRKIPGPAGEYQICNSQGGGFLDWRIPDSQREELRFKSEADFNKYLTDPLGEKARRDAAKSHDICHRIVFTHGDLNPRNILAERGRITGIVDWENAGWFPEYWEYTKAHYTVRSVMRWLADVVDVVFEGYRDELHVENMHSDRLGPL